MIDFENIDFKNFVTQSDIKVLKIIFIESSDPYEDDRYDVEILVDNYYVVGFSCSCFEEILNTIYKIEINDREDN